MKEVLEIWRLYLCSLLLSGVISAAFVLAFILVAYPA